MDYWRMLFGEELDRGSQAASRISRAFLATVALIAILTGAARGPAFAIGWFGLQCAAEALVWRSARIARQATPTRTPERAIALSASIFRAFVWALLGVAFWQTAEPAYQMLAIALLCSQTMYAIAIQAPFRAMMTVNAALPLLTILALLTSGATGQSMHLYVALFGWGLVAFYAVIVARANRANLAALAAAEQRALEATRAKSVFLSMIGHELRTPLNGIVGMSTALRRTSLSQAQHQQIDTLVQSSRSLEALLNDLLDHSKIEAGQMRLEAEPFDLHDVLHHVCDLWRDAARAKGIDLLLDIAPGSPRYLTGDALRLKQVLLNLVSNAVKFTADGTVTICARMIAADDRAANFEISTIDTGLGMSAEQRERLFKPFSQADASTARRFGGTGLGLAICRDLIALMQGDIGVQSVLGEGSTFTVTVTLPVSNPPDAQSQTHGYGEDIEALNLLVADDNATNLLVARTLLEAVGASISTADTGQAALDLIAISDFDAVLMDVRMPRMDGIEAVGHIRRNVATRHLPVIALTAEPESAQQLLAAGFDAVQAKPIRIAELLDAIAGARHARLSQPDRVVDGGPPLTGR